jgi:hypothetical protein
MRFDTVCEFLETRNLVSQLVLVCGYPLGIYAQWGIDEQAAEETREHAPNRG